MTPNTTDRAVVFARQLGTPSRRRSGARRRNPARDKGASFRGTFPSTPLGPLAYCVKFLMRYAVLRRNVAPRWIDSVLTSRRGDPSYARASSSRRQAGRQNHRFLLQLSVLVGHLASAESVTTHGSRLTGVASLGIEQRSIVHVSLVDTNTFSSRVTRYSRSRRSFAGRGHFVAPDITDRSFV